MNNGFYTNPSASDLDAIPAMPSKRSVIGSANSDDALVVNASGTEFEFETLDSNKEFLDLLSTHFLICNDKIKGKGEDSGFEETSENSV